MTLAQVLELLKGVLQFPGIVLEFVKLLRKTPQEKHEEILKLVNAEAAKFEEHGRPSWE